MFQHLTPDYQAKVEERWSPILDAGRKITNPNIRMHTALVLENIDREFSKKGIMNEAYDTSGTYSNRGAMGTQAGTNLNPRGGGAFGTAGDYGVNDSRIPTIVIPTVRRIFPELVAHELCGVQPMNGPVGFAFALRFQYGLNAAGGTVAPGSRQGTEMGYNTVYSDHTGATGLAELDSSGNYMASVPGTGAISQANDYWQSFAGSAGMMNGMGAGLNPSEWWAIGEDMPMSQFRLEKGVVEAKVRKLATHFSLDLAEDMMNMQGLDVESEMVQLMGYEVKQEIDRQLLAEMVKAAINGGASYISDWSPISADGRNQLERIGTIYTQVLIKSQQIAINTRRGPATFAVASPTAVALVERLGDFAMDNAGVQADSGVIGVSKVGTLRKGGMTLYRDTLAGGDYILLGYKGPTSYDSGIIYCPYIPLQVNKATGQDDFSPRIGLRTRYGVLSHLFGSANFYQFIRLQGLSNTLLASDGGRVFTY